MAVYGLTFTSSDARFAATLSVPVIALFATEWIHRGTLDGFAAVLSAHLWSFVLAWLFFIGKYTFRIYKKYKLF